MKSAPAGRKTPLPPLHLAIHGTTRRLLPLRAWADRALYAMEWGAQLPIRAARILYTHSTPVVAAGRRAATNNCQQHYTRMTHWRNSGPSPRYFSSPSRPPAQPPALHINAMRAWIYECEFPCQTKITALRPPTFHFLHCAHKAILTFVSQQDLFRTQRHWNEFMISSLFFPLIVYGLDFLHGQYFLSSQDNDFKITLFFYNKSPLSIKHAVFGFLDL